MQLKEIFKNIDLKNDKTMMILSSLITLIIIIAVYLIYAYNQGRPITALKFNDIMTKEGLEIYDVSSQFGEKYVASASVAYNKKSNYQIEFIVFTNEEDAKNAFNINKNSFVKVKTDDAEELSTSNEKFSKYALTTKDKYMYVSRRSNTLLYLSIDGSYKVEAANLVTKLGY